MLKKNLFHIIFVFSILGYLLDIALEYWLFMILSFFILSVINFKEKFDYKFPLGEFMSLVFFIDNTFSFALLYFLRGNQLHIGDFQYTQIKVEEYLPFSFLSSQAILIGYLSIKQRVSTPWINFVTKFDTLINRNNLRTLIIIGSFGIFLQIFKLSPFFALLLTSFFNCGLIGFALYTKKPTNIYILLGLGVSILSAARSGMFGNLTYFIVYYLMLYLLILSATKKNVNWIKVLSFGIIGFYLLALLQNVKTDYRARSWGISGQATSQNLYNTVNTNFDTKNPLDIDFYMPLIFRLNQGYIVTSAIKKVPSNEPFANGSTIFTSVIDAFVPRVLNENKEEAGGRQKIKRFTNITLVGETSMNIGLLGETYANFGKSGSVLFLFFYGLLVGLFEKNILKYSIRNPIILVFFPIYFQFLVGSGSDFLMVFNGIVKSSILIFAIILIFNWQKKQNPHLINSTIQQS